MIAHFIENEIGISHIVRHFRSNQIHCQFNTFDYISMLLRNFLMQLWVRLLFIFDNCRSVSVLLKVPILCIIFRRRINFSWNRTSRNFTYNRWIFLSQTWNLYCWFVLFNNSFVIYSNLKELHPTNSLKRILCQHSRDNIFKHWTDVTWKR